jgi:hypothetical protein
VRKLCVPGDAAVVTIAPLGIVIRLTSDMESAVGGAFWPKQEERAQ